MTPELDADYFQEHFHFYEENDELLEMRIADEFDEIRVSMQGTVRTSNRGQLPTTYDIDNLLKCINLRFIAAAESCEPLPSIEDMREHVQAADKSTNMQTEQDTCSSSERLVHNGRPDGIESSPVLIE